MTILNESQFIVCFPGISKLFEELNIDCCYGKSITLKECCNWQHIQPSVLVNKIVVALAANQNQSTTK